MLASAIVPSAADYVGGDSAMIDMRSMDALVGGAGPAFQKFKSALEAKGYTNFKIASGTRSVKYQQHLSSTVSGPVGDPAQSYHNYGYAIDINITNPGGKALLKGQDIPEWKKIGDIAAENDIKWQGPADSNHFDWASAPDMSSLYSRFKSACKKFGTVSDLWGGNKTCNMPWQIIAGSDPAGNKGRSTSSRRSSRTKQNPPDGNSGGAGGPPPGPPTKPSPAGPAAAIIKCPVSMFYNPLAGESGCKKRGYTHDPDGNRLNEGIDSGAELLRDLIRETITARSFAQIDTYSPSVTSTSRTPTGKKQSARGHSGSRKFLSPKPMSPERKSKAAAILGVVSLAMLGNDRDFISGVLNNLGLPATDERLKFFGGWAASENSTAQNNPLNSTWPGSGKDLWERDPGMSTVPGSENGIKEYSTKALGIEATAEDIRINHSELLELLRDSSLSSIDYSLGYDFSSWTGIPDTNNYIFRSLEAGDISRDTVDSEEIVSKDYESEDIESESAIESEK
jgi:hypothetical protein